jgi:signal transduction histidine kinase
MFIGLVAVFIFSAYIAKPIKELSKIAERMSELDFDAKYTGKDKGEVGLLGNSMNDMSSKLEKNISKLKSANLELKRDIDKKEQIEQMRKDFLSNVSHELKTPIALIQGYAEGLKDGIADDDPESREFYCDVIVDEAGKMNKMVKQLMTLNELEFGKNNYNLERFDIVAVIQNYLKSADILAKQKDVTVQIEDSEPIYVWADEFKVEEVLQNYYSNALNHIDGDRIIKIKFKKGDGVVRVSVYNTGDPIPQDSIEHLWEKFYEVDKARTREYGGSGVGLSIVKAIMDSMGQRYGVVNCEKGVEFWFELDCEATED